MPIASEPSYQAERFKGAGDLSEKAIDMDGDLRARVVTLEHASAAKERRLSALEAWQRQSEIGEAKRGEQWATLQRDLGAMATSITEVQGTLRWIGRTIIGAIIVAVMAFMIRGGFAP